MSPSKNKKRSSILKKRRSSTSNGETPEQTTSATAKLPRRGILFSDKNTVKEFLPCDEKTTIWGNSYETSIAKSEGSSDNSQTLKKLSLDFSSTSEFATSLVTVTNESEKENLPIPQVTVSWDDGQRSSSSIQSESNSGITLSNITVEMNADERKRIKKYGVDNLNVTNMILDGSSSLAVNHDDNMIVSPRKTLYFHKNQNFSISLNDKVLMKKSEADKCVIFENSSNASLRLESDEENFLRLNRLTTHQQVNMEQTPPANNSRGNASYTNKTEPIVFRKPAVPTMFKSPSFKMVEESSINVDSPPIKVANLQNQSGIVEEFMDFMVNDTPTKNLCHQMCTSRKHGITPLQHQPPQKIVFSSTKPDWLNRPFNTNTTPLKSSRRSSEILSSLGLKLDSPGSERKNFIKNDSMELDVTKESCQEKSELQEKMTNEMATAQDNVNHNRPNVYEDSIPEDIYTVPGLIRNRITVYEDSINVEELLDASLQPSVKKSVRKTLFESSMDETNPTIPVPGKSPFDLSVDININEIAPDIIINQSNVLVKENESEIQEMQMSLDVNVPNHHHTIQHAIDISVSNSPLNISQHKETEIEETLLGSKLEVEKQYRRTIYEESIVQDTQSVPKLVIAKSNRLTVYEGNIEIDDKAGNASLHPHARTSRKTLVEGSMDETNYAISMNDTTGLEISKGNSFRRTECQECEIDNNTLLIIKPDNSKHHSNRFFDDSSNSMPKNENGNSIQPAKIVFSAHKLSCFNRPFNAYPAPPIASTYPPGNLSSLDLPVELSVIDIKADESMDLENMESNFTRKTQYQEKQIDEEVMEPEAVAPHHNRQTIYEASILEEPAEDSDQTIEAAVGCIRKNVITDRKTRFESSIEETIHTIPVEEKFSDMCINKPLAGASSGNQTFTLNRIDSKRLMNVTDADFDSLIDDESNPCVNESVPSTPLIQTSFSGNVSNYHQALQDFVNITIQDSPFNMSVDGRTPKPSNFHERDFDSPADLSVQFDNLVTNLEKKGSKVKPRLAIDDFFDNLNIRPVKIKRLPDLKDIYKSLREAREESKQIVAEARLEAEKKYGDADLKFEMKLKRMRDEVAQDIERKKQEGYFGIPPIFPETRDFDFLLTNKFETDEHLSKFWEVDLVFAWNRQYKFVHKKLKIFKINLTIQCQWNSLNDSTIPIYLENVLLYRGWNYRGIISTRLALQAKELKRALGTDTFISKCSSMNHLFSFLDYYHGEVMKTVTLVNNLLKIVNNNHANLARNDSDFVSVHKRLFTREDIVDVKITIEYIKDTSINDVSIKGLTSYIYKLKPRAKISEMKGLMLIETVLFDVEKFLSENTDRLQMEES